MNRKNKPRNPANHKMTRHHIISKNQGDLFNVFNRGNIKQLPRQRHRGLHEYFRNEHHPQDQIRRLYQDCKSVLSEKVQEEMEKLLSLPRDEFYNVKYVKDDQTNM